MITILRSFITKRDGSVLPLVGLSFFVLLGSMGLAVDMARGFIVKSQLSAAIDAAGLAGGAVMNSSQLSDDITKYFHANFPNDFMGATVDGPYVNVHTNNTKLTITATAEVDTLLMQFLGSDMMDVGASAEITRELRGMEVVLVMDNTGSMHGSKMSTMIQGATDLVNILYGGEEELDNLWIGLVPYTATVNIGTQHSGWLTAGSLDALDFNPTSWKGCVEARAYPEDTTDNLPATGGTWEPFFWESASDNIWPPVNDAITFRNDGTGPNLGCGPAITPLTDNKQLVLDAIGDMGAWHRGGTLTNLGLAWGWRAISPKWRGLWGSPTPSHLPLDYNTPLMEKVIIILTDGNNQLYDHPPAGPDGSDYTSYDRLGAGVLGTTDEDEFTDTVNQRMQEVCTAIKQQDIILYTITFRLNNSTTQQLFRDCASDPAYYFNSPSNDDLIATFHAIADSLGKLRLSK